MGREMPAKAFVRSKLEEEKEKQVIDELVAANHVEVPEDFTVPEVSDEQIKEMMQKQQQMSDAMPAPPDEAGAGPDLKGAKPAPKKAEPKKK
jgi:hypothetical protein